MRAGGEGVAGDGDEVGGREGGLLGGLNEKSGPGEESGDDGGEGVVERVAAGGQRGVLTEKESMMSGRTSN